MKNIQNKFWLAILLLASIIGQLEAKNINKPKKPVKPNILYILVDDLGYEDIGVQGCKQFKTPNIDKIFNRGVRFTQGYVSNSVCAPSRAGLLTGRMGGRFGFEANLPHKRSSKPGSTIGLDPKEKTMADVLKTAGYKTYGIGKWHLGDNDDYFHPNKRGFDDFVGIVGGSRTYWPLLEHNHEQSLQHNGVFIDESKIKDFYITDYLTDRAVDFIETQTEENPKEPFFMYMSYTAPHGPMHAKEKFLHNLDHIKSPERRIYAGMMLSLDENVGRLLDTLDKLNITEDTLIVFMSDNGGPLYGKNWSYNGILKGKKGSLFEGGIRVPYGISWKGTIPPNQVSKTPVISLDLLPTFAAAANAKMKNIETDGVNLLPLLTNKVSHIDARDFYWRRGGGVKIALIEPPFKYYKSPTGEVLINLEEDIREKNNIATKYPKVLKRLRDKWEKTNKEMIAPSWKSDWKPAKAKKKKKH